MGSTIIAAELYMSPLITIGITCFNAEETILRALNSALAQNYPNVEILIVDDGSTDSSRAVISDFLKTDHNRPIRYIPHEKNSGFPAALNTLVNYAQGEYIAFFDDDDVSDANRLELQLARIEIYAKAHNTENLLCYTNRYIYMPGATTPVHIARAIGHVATEPYGQTVADHILWRSYDNNFTWGIFGSCTLMAKTALLKKMGFDETFRRSAELDMAVRISQTGAHFIAVNEPLVHQFKTPTKDKGGKMPLKYNILLRKKHRQLLNEKGVYLAALCFAYYQFYGNAGKKLQQGIWFILACLCAPHKVMLAKLQKS